MRRFTCIRWVGMALFLTTPVWAQSPQEQKPSIPRDAFGDPLPPGAIGRIGTLRYRVPENYALQPQLSPDGKLLAAIGNTGQLEIWELPTWTKRKPAALPKSPRMAAFTHDSKQLVVFDQRGQYHLIDLAAGKSVLASPAVGKKQGIPRDDQQAHLFVARDRQTVIRHYSTSGKDPMHRFAIWDLAKNEVRDTLAIPIAPTGRSPSGFTLAVSADGRLAALETMSADLKKKSKGKYGVEIWDLATGKPQCQFETGFRLTHLAFAPDGKSLAGASAQAQVRLYDAATGKQIRSSVLSGSVFTHLAYSPDGKSLYLADQDSVYRFDASTLMPTATFKAPISIGPRQFGFQPGGKVLALATAGRALHFWEATTGQLFSPKGLPTAAITDLRFTPEQTLFVACANGSASWWNPRAGDKLRDLKLNGKDRPAANSYPRGAPMFALSPAMHFIVGSNMNFGEFDLFDAKSGQKLFSERSKNGDFTLCFFDADRKVAVGSGKDIRVRDPRSGKELYRLELPVRQQEQLLRIEASPSGKRIAAFSFDQNTDFDRIFLWDVDQKKTMREWPVQDGFTAMRFSADEQWLGLGDGSGNLQLIDIGRGGRDRVLAAPETQRDWAVTDLAFSADGRQVAFAVGFPYSGRDSSRIYVFEMASKKLRLELPGHEAGTVARLAFSPDGAVLASGASDTTVLTWKAGLRAFIDPRATAVPQPGDLDAWFARLADSDAKAAFQAMIKMAQAPAHAVKCLEARIEPARAPELAGPLPQMIRELGSNTFAVRNKANRALHKLGAAVEPDLREAMKGADLEMHRRIEVLLDSILNREWTAEELRHARAVEVLHAIASPEARALLTRWAGGDPFAILTGEARKALALR